MLYVRLARQLYSDPERLLTFSPEKWQNASEVAKIAI